MKRQAVLSVLVFAAFIAAGTAYRAVRASDHDDGENDVKSRALNLTDHFAFKNATGKLALVQYSNPRSLPGFQYFFSTQARYEVHVTRVADKKTVPTGADDIVFRFEFGAPDANNQQVITMTRLDNGVVVGSDASAKTTTIGDAKIGTGNAGTTVTIAGKAYQLYAGARADSFFFDVERFFQVRAFAADRFLNGNASATLAPTCNGGALATAGVNLFNEPSCAPDFTKNYNVSTITFNMDISTLQANNETTFDTWSTISIPQ